MIIRPSQPIDLASKGTLKRLIFCLRRAFLAVKGAV
jgi:hypothetical protein